MDSSAAEGSPPVGAGQEIRHGNGWILVRAEIGRCPIRPSRPSGRHGHCADTAVRARARLGTCCRERCEGPDGPFAEGCGGSGLSGPRRIQGRKRAGTNHAASRAHNRRSTPCKVRRAGLSAERAARIARTACATSRSRCRCNGPGAWPFRTRCSRLTRPALRNVSCRPCQSRPIMILSGRGPRLRSRSPALPKQFP